LFTQSPPTKNERERERDKKKTKKKEEKGNQLALAIWYVAA